MANLLPPLYVRCPLSDRDWTGRPRRWSDVPDLYSLPCPSCGRLLKLSVVNGRIVDLPGWVGEVPKDHELTLAGTVAPEYRERVGSRAPSGAA